MKKRIALFLVLIGMFATMKPDGYAVATAAPYMGQDTMHYFAGNGSEGSYPTNSMIVVDDSIVYGATASGGSYGTGTFYKVINSGTWWSTSSTFSILHHFWDGSECTGRLAKDGSGYIYGTCRWGGTYSGGIVYRISISSGALTVLHNFGDTGDGIIPEGVVRDNSGNLYGVTTYDLDLGCLGSGCGMIWKLSPSGGGYSYSILHQLTGYPTGENPMSITLGSDGNLYGTTIYSGSSYLNGVVWRYNTSTSTYSKIADLATGGDINPGLTQIPTSLTGGKLEFWGTISNGGTNSLGSVYKLTETYAGSGSFTNTVMHSFNSGTDEGFHPYGELVFSSNFAAFDALYGTTAWGGVSGTGSFFRIDLSGNYSEIPSNPGQWNGAVYPSDNPYGMVEGKIGGDPVFFGSSMNVGHSDNGWLWYIYLF